MRALAPRRRVAALSLQLVLACVAAVVLEHGRPPERGSAGLIRLEGGRGQGAWIQWTGIREKTKDCLNFLHIPKTAGTSIEHAMEAARAKHPGDPKYRGWGYHDGSLRCEEPIVWVEGKMARRCKVGAMGNCFVWHIPPAMDDTVLDSYAPCDTFCVVRHPVERFISEWHFKHDHFANGTVACSVERFKEYADRELLPHKHDCHDLLQTEFARSCHHVLRFEKLHEQFPRLMEEYGLDVELPANYSLESVKCPSLTPENLDDDVLGKIQTYFAPDLEYLGYEDDD